MLSALKAVLPMEGASRENDQFRGLQAGGFIVEAGIAGCESGWMRLAFAENFLEAFETVSYKILDADDLVRMRRSSASWKMADSTRDQE